MLAVGRKEKSWSLEYRRFVFGSESQTFVMKIVAIAIITGLLLSALPAFTGQLEGNFFNESQKGSWIPADYSNVRSYLNSHNVGSTLVAARHIDLCSH